MKTIVLPLIIAVLALFQVTDSYAAKQELCHQVSPNLAKDQRDTDRLECLKDNASKLSITQCLRVANAMEYSISAEDARLFCLYEKTKSAQDCISITKKMEFPDSGDEARWHCLRSHTKKLSKSACHGLSKAMAYPTNKDRALMFCKSEL